MPNSMRWSWKLHFFATEVENLLECGLHSDRHAWDVSIRDAANSIAYADSAHSPGEFHHRYKLHQLCYSSTRNFRRALLFRGLRFIFIVGNIERTFLNFGSGFSSRSFRFISRCTALLFSLKCENLTKQMDQGKIVIRIIVHRHVTCPNLCSFIILSLNQTLTSCRQSRLPPLK